MKNQYLTQSQIMEMVETGFNVYIMTADKKATIRSIREHSMDEFNIKPNHTAVFSAFTQAMAMYEVTVGNTKILINNA